MIRREWLRYYDELPDSEYPAQIIQSWDTAVKNGAQNDYSVCSTWLKKGKDYYLIDVTRGRYEYPRLKETALTLADRYKPNEILIEDASTGSPLAQELEEEGIFSVQLVPVEHDKRARVYVQQAKFENGHVLFPKNAGFVPALEAEILTFPQCKHDDQVDSVMQALAYEGSTYDSSFSWL